MKATNTHLEKCNIKDPSVIGRETLPQQLLHTIDDCLDINMDVLHTAKQCYVKYDSNMFENNHVDNFDTHIIATLCIVSDRELTKAITQSLCVKMVVSLYQKYIHVGLVAGVTAYNVVKCPLLYGIYHLVYFTY